VVYSTLSSREIEKSTSLAKERIRLPAQDPFFVYNLSVSGGGNLFGYAKVFRQPKNIAPVDLNALVNRAAVSGTLVAIVFGASIYFHVT